MLSSSTLQSLCAINARNIDLAQISYLSYKDIMKDFRECGKSDDEAYKRYVKAKDKELAKLHLLEKNQRALLAELDEIYYQEYMCRLADEWAEGDVYE